VDKKRIISGLAVFMLFAGACLGYPSRSSYNTNDTRDSQGWDALHFASPPSQSVRFAAQRDLASRLREQPGIVLSDIDPVYLNALLPSAFIAAPIDGKHDYMWSYAWRYGRPQALALVQQNLQHSVPVYALFVSKEDAGKNQSRLPNVPGYEWRILNNSDRDAVILKVVLLGSGEAAQAQQ
jgi:hypothetical protein